MRFSLLVVVAALTSFMSVSATPAVFSRECSADYHPCGQNSQCCSGKCGYNHVSLWWFHWQDSTLSLTPFVL